MFKCYYYESLLYYLEISVAPVAYASKQYAPPGKCCPYYVQHLGRGAGGLFAPLTSANGRNEAAGGSSGLGLERGGRGTPDDNEAGQLRTAGSAGRNHPGPIEVAILGIGHRAAWKLRTC